MAREGLLGSRTVLCALWLIAACAPESVRRQLRVGDGGRDTRASRDAAPLRSDAGAGLDTAPGGVPPAADAAGGAASGDGHGAETSGGQAPPADAAAERPRDTAPSASHAGRKALFVTDTVDPLSPGDAALKTRLESRGFVTTLARDSEVAAASATGKDLILISNSANPLDVGQRLRDVRVPIVCLESYLFDDLGMTAGVLDVDYGLVGSQTQLAIANAAHALAAGFSKTVTVSSAPHSVVWGLPGATAARVATAVGNANQVTIFGYTTGAMMVSLVAPARRVGWFAGASMSATLTADALKLFDAAVDWALM